MTKLFFTACFLLLLLINGPHHVAEARRHRETRKEYTLFVFGDSFVDAGGNLPRSAKSRESRGWYYPYGSSDSAHRNAATGRLSDGFVQSDYLAMILGNDESPPAYSGPNNELDGGSGVNFAMPFSGALYGPQEEEALAGQVDQFSLLVSRGIIQDTDLEDSVALVSVSNGHDYTRLISDSGSFTSQQTNDYIVDVTNAIVAAVRRLREQGVSKVLVNSLPPVGCAPWRSRPSGYARCDDRGNAIANAHNMHLSEALALSGIDEVRLLDLYSAFNSAAAGSSSSSSAPCCDTSDPSGYCGQEDDAGRALYSVCSDPGSYFYWDQVHPTQAGWSAVMDNLGQQIKDFLVI